MTTSKLELFERGIILGKKFLKKNNIPCPLFLTYEDGCKANNRSAEILKRVMGGPLIGTATGFYHDGHVFVNIAKTAWPVKKPQYMSWSYPCWKTDRTAVGVVAHELGHHVSLYLSQKKLVDARHGEVWATLIKENKKRVTSYEPIPEEALAETMRLFILNPVLLKKGIPIRYKFLRSIGLKPSERRDWKEVLNHHKDYITAGRKWIKT